jgi:hypothetical protein
MSERREFFRVRTLARVRLRAVSKPEAELLRRSLYARPGEAKLRFASESEESGAREWRALEAALHQISLALERIERRLEALERRAASGAGATAETAGPLEISLSAAGFAGPFGLELEPDQLVWVELDLCGSGLPPIAALARSVRASASQEQAFHFEDIHAEDRERIVQLALRLQSQMLRAERAGAGR